MSEPYYAVAVAAMRDRDDGLVEILMHPMVVHPEGGNSPEQLAITTAKLDMMPEAGGWRDHYAVAMRLDIALVATIEADKTAVPNELRIVRYPVEVS